MIVLTAKGKAKRDISREAVKRFNDAVAARVGKQKLKIFKEVLEEINEIAVNGSN